MADEEQYWMLVASIEKLEARMLKVSDRIQRKHGAIVPIRTLRILARTNAKIRTAQSLLRDLARSIAHEKGLL